MSKAWGYGRCGPNCFHPDCDCKPDHFPVDRCDPSPRVMSDVAQSAKVSAEKMLDLLQCSTCFRGDVCQNMPCACAQSLADASQPPAAPVETKPFSAKENLREVIAEVRADIDAAEGVASWPPLKMALWRVLMAENLNDGHYIKAFDLIEKLYGAAQPHEGSSAGTVVALCEAMHDAFMAMCSHRDSPDDEVFQDAIDALGLACGVADALTSTEPQTSVWQPIETAPKDGSPIDLLFPYPRGRTIDCMWRQGGVDGDGHWVWLKPIWGSQPGLGIDWHLLPESEWEVCSYPNMEPTHWMPACSLPRPQRGAGE